MAIYRNVSLSFWTDSKVDDEFTAEDKYFYLYLITNPHTNICGCYEIGKKAIERETGYTWDTIIRLISRMQNVHNVIRYDDETKEVLIINWGKYNWGSSSKVKTAVIAKANSVKNKEFREFILRAVEDKNFDADCVAKKEKKKTAAEPERKKEQHTGVIDNQVPGSRTESFTAGWPDLPEVEAYVKEKGYGLQAKAFWFYNENHYWKDSNGDEIKNWKKYLDACEASGAFQKVI